MITHIGMCVDYISGPCQFKGCTEDAIYLAHLQSPAPGRFAGFCDKHLGKAVDADGKPEHQVTCPNCDCTFGVN